MNVRLGAVMSKKENNFDFIRFLAAVGVIFSHSYPLTGALNEPLIILSNNKFTIGSIAVTSFFILSGFLITKSYVNSKSTLLYFRARALRIYPALICVVLITVFFIGPLVYSSSPVEYFQNKKNYVYLINLTSLRHFSSSLFLNNPLPQVNGCLWTLPHEMLCYCMVPIVGACVKRRFVEFLFLSLLTASLFSTYILFNVDFYLNLFCFACGSSIFLLRNRIVLKHSVAVVCFALTVINMRFNPTKSLAFMINAMTFSYVLFYLSYLKPTYFKNFAKKGDFSYGIYLWGFLIQQLIIFQFDILSPGLNFIVSTLITLPIAFVSWHLIEKQALKLKVPRVNTNVFVSKKEKETELV